MEEKQLASNRWDADQKKRYAFAREDVAFSIGLLAQEIGVDKFISQQHWEWLSAEYWSRRCQELYAELPLVTQTSPTGEPMLIHPLQMSPTGVPVATHPFSGSVTYRLPILRPYVLFHRLAATELGLVVLPDIAERMALRKQQEQLVDALRTACRPDLYEWLDGQRRRLLAIDVSTNDPDPDSYTEVLNRVLARRP